MNGDPFGVWNPRRRLKWAAIASLCFVAFGPGFLSSLIPPQSDILDFYQEWSSARSLFTDLPVYASLDETVPVYLGMQKEPGTEWYWGVNVHPPTSILLAVPLQGLNYRDAFLVWNLLSLAALGATLWLIVRELEIPFHPAAVLPIISILLVCDPLRQQVIQGQLNLVLLLVLTCVWSADRHDRPVLAGSLLAFATAVKLFPGFLFLLFLMKRNWKACQAGVVAFAVITLLTACLTGTEAFATYIHDILPTTGRWRTAWNNASLTGFWFKLFDPVEHGRHLTPLLESPLLARVGTVASVIAVLGFLVVSVRNSNDCSDRDQEFGLSMTAMLLVSPVSWEHYFLLLILPLAIQWLRIPDASSVRAMFTVAVAVLCLPIILVCNVVIPGGFFAGSATSMHTVTVLSLQCYALTGLFALQLRTLRQSSFRSVSVSIPA